MSAAGVFCEQMFLDPKMKIFVQGSEVKPRGLLSSLDDTHRYSVNIDRWVPNTETAFCAQHGRSPYNVIVHVRVLGCRLCDPTCYRKSILHRGLV